jgi:hypothetical protein
MASRLGHGQIQPHRMADKAPKAKMLIKAHRRIVLGVDHQRKYCGLRAHRAGNRIDDQCRPEPLSMKLLVDGEPADQGSRDGRVARQATGHFRRQLGKRDTCGSKSVISHDAAGWTQCDEAVAYSATNILCRAFPQIPVQCFGAAGKSGAIVTRVQSFGCKPFDQRETAMTLR